MSRSAYVGLTALMCAAATIWLLPAASIGRGADLQGVDNVLTSTTQQLGAAVGQAVAPTQRALKSTGAKTKSALQQTKRSTAKAGERATRATATDPPTQPPLHGTNPHGQGGVAVVDVNPSAERPLGANPDGSDSGPEEVVVGRARGEQTAGGNYHGHITILALFGSELAGVDTNEGETKNGPLQPVQTGILDPLCTSTGQQVCLSVLTANSTTNANGSANDFALARAQALGLGVGAAESGGTIGETTNPDCQNALGGARTANVVTARGPAAAAANSSVTSQSCRGQASTTTHSSEVIQLGNAGIPLPAAGCANGTPDTVVEIPLLAKIVCNATDVAGAAVVRHALDVFALNAGGTSLVKETTAAAEANTVAPSGPENGAPACSDGVDNDGDGLIDIADPGCHTDGNPNNPDSYNPNDPSEVDARPTGGSGEGTGGGRRPECSDNRDNDNDGHIDERDPGCHTDGNPNNPASYDPDDTSEIDVIPEDVGGAGAGDGARTADAGALPFTGTNVVGLALAGLLLLAGGLLLRRREGARASV